MTGNYDAVAPFYDFLARLVFGKAIIDANAFLVEAVPANSRILIVGGGTGFILEQIAEMHAAGLQITYVELSQKMIEIARARNAGANKVEFVRGGIQEEEFTGKFSVIITPFLLDNFNEHNHLKVFDKLHQLLNKGGLWLFADFKVDAGQSFWQKPMLGVMYLFFSIMSNVETRKLPGSEKLFTKYNYQKLSTRSFYKGFILSIVYRKQ